jgi:FkbM family methyltransferase
LEVLRGNAERWSRMPGVAAVEVVPKAVGSHVGVARFCASDGDSAVGKLGDTGKGINVPVTTIDHHLMAKGNVPTLIKLDIEGHEMEALLGAGSTLADNRLKHVILEDWSFAQSDAVRQLRDRGFQIFALDRSWHGPVLRSQFARPELPVWEAPNYLGTRETDAVIGAFRPRGWRCLGC